MSLTLISHFYNESFLLPYFLRHHVPMFDQGVMINHASTDDSVDIIRRLAPGWEIVDTALECFDAERNDREVESHEKRFPDTWKLVLNTTEFVLHPDLRGFIRHHEGNNASCIWMKDFAIVDTIAEQHEDVTDAPLWTQREHGFDAHSVRSRMIHRWECGEYALGRHSSHRWRKGLELLNDQLVLAWYGWSPMSRCRPRKLQIQDRIPATDKAWRRGAEHIQTPESLQAEFEKFAAGSVHLPTAYPAYRDALAGLLAASR